MSSKSEYTIFLDDFELKHESLAGDAARKLYDLTQLSIPVPQSFFITSKAFDEFIYSNNFQDEIVSLLLKVNIDKAKEVEKIATQIQNMILTGNIPKDVKEEINKAYSKLSGFHKAYVGLHYSALKLDLDPGSYGDKAPFKYDLFGEAALESGIKEIWASLFNSKAIFYREAKSYGDILTCAVVVQKAMFAEVSGSAFSIDPISDDKTKIEVEAILGLPEPLYRNEINPDIYLIDKKSQKIIQKNIVAQEWMLVRKGRIKDNEEPNIKVKISDAWKKSPKIDDRYIQYLGKLVSTLEKYNPSPLSISWLLEGGKIYISQVKNLPKLIIKDHEWKITPTVTALKSKLEIKEVPVAIVEEQKDMDEYVSQVVDKVSSAVLPAQAIEIKEPVSAHAATSTPKATPTLTPAIKPIENVVTKKVPDVTGILHSEKNIADTVISDFESGVPVKNEKKPEKINTVTKLFFEASSEKDIDELVRMTFDGVAPFNTESFDPQVLNKNLERLAASSQKDPIIVKLSTLNEDATGLEKELAALKEIRNKRFYKNVWVCIKWTPDEEQIAETKKLLTSKGFKRTANFKIYVLIDSPAGLIQIADLESMGIDGFIIDFSRIASLTLDKAIGDITSGTIIRNKSLHKILEDGFKAINKLKVNAIIVLNDLNLDRKLLKLLIDAGVHAISTHKFDYVNIKNMLQEIETEKLLNAPKTKIKRRKKKISFK